MNYHKPEIRHELLMLLSSKGEDQLKTVDAQHVLGQEALEKVQKVLLAEEGEAFVADLFFYQLCYSVIFRTANQIQKSPAMRGFFYSQTLSKMKIIVPDSLQDTDQSSDCPLARSGPVLPLN